MLIMYHIFCINIKHLDIPNSNMLELNWYKKWHVTVQYSMLLRLLECSNLSFWNKSSEFQTVSDSEEHLVVFPSGNG